MGTHTHTHTQTHACPYTTQGQKERERGRGEGRERKTEGGRISLKTVISKLFNFLLFSPSMLSVPGMQ